MSEMGHTTSKLALEMYAKALDRAERQRFASLVGPPYQAITGNRTGRSDRLNDEALRPATPNAPK